MNARLERIYEKYEITTGDEEDDWRENLRYDYGLMHIPDHIPVPVEACEVQHQLWRSVMALMAIDQLCGDLDYDNTIDHCFKFINLWKEDHGDMYGLTDDRGFGLPELRPIIQEALTDYQYVLDEYIRVAQAQKEKEEQESNKKQYLGWKTVAA